MNARGGMQINKTNNEKIELLKVFSSDITNERELHSKLVEFNGNIENNEAKEEIKEQNELEKVKEGIKINKIERKEVLDTFGVIDNLNNQSKIHQTETQNKDTEVEVKEDGKENEGKLKSAKNKGFGPGINLQSYCTNKEDALHRKVIDLEIFQLLQFKHVICVQAIYVILYEYFKQNVIGGKNPASCDDFASLLKESREQEMEDDITISQSLETYIPLEGYNYAYEDIKIMKKHMIVINMYLHFWKKKKKKKKNNIYNQNNEKDIILQKLKGKHINKEIME
ncbi:hypothetical protein RFI_33793, partial [Reticulomyxa filosa]